MVAHRAPVASDGMRADRPVGKAAVAPPRPSRVEPVTPDRLAATIGADLLPGGGGARAVTGATVCTQHVRPGDLFAALPGTRAHGADFCADAVAAGAAAILTDRAGAGRPAVRASGLAVLVHDQPRAVLGRLAATIYGDPSTKLTVLGVTGTAGKTTTTYLLRAGLAAAGHQTGLIGTVETVLAGRRLDSALTTPEAPDLQALFAVMAEQGVTHVPMEVSSHALAQGRVAGTRYTVGAFTNLSHDHLDFHADMEDYFAAKAKLFDGRSAIEVVCTDTPWGQRLVRPGTVTVSTTGAAATWTAAQVETSPAGGQTFTAIGPYGNRFDVRIGLPGSFNVANALLAVAVLDVIGVPRADITRGLAEARVPGRMEPVALGQEFVAVIDYSHKPVAVTLALDAVRARAAGRVLLVLGCGGDRDRAKRPLMGAAAARGADLTIVTDDNPRGEDPAAIRAQMLAGALDVPAASRGEVIEIADRRSAIRYAVARARPGDVVVVAGKGHETGQEIAGVVHPFSDRDELTAAITEVLR